MIEFHGYQWPDYADANVIRYINHAHDMRFALKHTKGRNTVVQAGGHCGIWPLWLARKFENVFTFEPEPQNWQCLQANCAAQIDSGKIVPFHACLGEAPTRIALKTNTKNTGGHKGTKEPGSTPVVTIDGLQLAACDLIVLDVEGMELPALKGALRTLTEFRPTLMLEDRGHGDRYGWGGHDMLFSWLKSLGYRRALSISYDVVMVHQDKGK